MKRRFTFAAKRNTVRLTGLKEVKRQLNKAKKKKTVAKEKRNSASKLLFLVLLKYDKNAITTS